MDFFAVKFDGKDVNPVICKEDSWVDVTLISLRPTRYISIFLSRIQRLQIFKIPIKVIGTLR